MRSIPLHTTLNTECDSTQYGTHNDHRMKTYQTAFKEIFHGETLAPTVVISVTDHETRKDKEEIHGKITVVESLDIATTGKSISLEYMIPYHHKSRYTAKSVKKIIMCFGICKG